MARLPKKTSCLGCGLVFPTSSACRRHTARAAACERACTEGDGGADTDAAHGVTQLEDEVRACAEEWRTCLQRWTVDTARSKERVRSLTNEITRLENKEAMARKELNSVRWTLSQRTAERLIQRSAAAQQRAEVAEARARQAQREMRQNVALAEAKLAKYGSLLALETLNARGANKAVVLDVRGTPMKTSLRTLRKATGLALAAARNTVDAPVFVDACPATMMLLLDVMAGITSNKTIQNMSSLVRWQLRDLGAQLHLDESVGHLLR